MRCKAIVGWVSLAASLAAGVAACSVLLPFSGYDAETDGTEAGPPGTDAGYGPDASPDLPPDSASTADATADAVADAAPYDSPYARTVLADGPVLYVRLGDPAGSSGPAQRTADGGLLVGMYGSGVTCGAPGAIVGDPDTAVTLDGTGTDFAVYLTDSVSFAFQGQTSYAGEIWVRPEPARAAIDAYSDFWSRNEIGASSGREAYTAGTLGSSFFSERITSGDTSNVATTAALLDAAAPPTWFHVAVSYDSTSGLLSLYVNGALAGTQPTTGAALDFEGPVALLLGGEPGYDGGNLPTFYAGALDEFALYAGVLDAGAVLRHYQVGSGAVVP